MFAFGVVDPVLVGLLEESLEALPPGDSALRARLMARLAAALQPSPTSAEPVALAREAIAIARRLGDAAALLDTLYAAISALMDIVGAPRRAALNLEVEQLASAADDRERLLRTHLRLAICHLGVGEIEACDARLAAFEALAVELRAPWYGWWAGMLRAVRATMDGRFAEAERLGRRGATPVRPPATRPSLGSGSRTAKRALRTADRHEEMLAWEPEGRRSRAVIYSAAAWQAMGSALTYARLEQADEARLHAELLPESFRPPDRQHLRAVLRRRGARRSRACDELARTLHERILAARRTRT